MRVEMNVFILTDLFYLDAEMHTSLYLLELQVLTVAASAM